MCKLCLSIYLFFTLKKTQYGLVGDTVCYECQHGELQILEVFSTSPFSQPLSETES